MDKLKIHFDPTDNSLVIWLQSPEQMAYLSPVEDAAEGDLFLIHDAAGRVIGFEAQFYHLAPGSLSIEMETAPLLAPEAQPPTT